MESLYKNCLIVLGYFSTFAEKVWQLAFSSITIGDVSYTLLEIMLGSGFLIALTAILVRAITG